jgi:hypothetical protein
MQPVICGVPIGVLDAFKVLTQPALLLGQLK